MKSYSDIKSKSAYAWGTLGIYRNSGPWGPCGGGWVNQAGWATGERSILIKCLDFTVRFSLDFKEGRQEIEIDRTDLVPGKRIQARGFIPGNLHQSENPMSVFALEQETEFKQTGQEVFFKTHWLEVKISNT